MLGGFQGSQTKFNGDGSDFSTIYVLVIHLQFYIFTFPYIFSGSVHTWSNQWVLMSDLN